MVRKNSSVLLIISVVGIALAGLLGVQAYWAQHAYRLTERNFKSNVNDALKKTADEINRQLTCFEVFSKVKINPHEGFYIIKQKWANKKFLSADKSQPDTVPVYFADANSQMPFQWNNIMFSHPVYLSMVLQFRYLMDNEDLSLSSGNVFEKVTSKNYRDALSDHKPIEVTYDPHDVDSLLKKNLRDVSIFENYRLGYIRSDTRAVEYADNRKDTTALLNSPFHVPITQSEYFSRPYELALVFEDYSHLIFADIRKLLITSILIVVVLLISFYVFMRIILRQRRLSELKNDFINNMTHEFKTPLTNMSLAFEKMADVDFSTDPSRERVFKIIGQETERLRDNVERILQIARFEKEKLHLSLDQVDVHQLIHRAITAFDHLFQQNGILFRCNLSASRCVILADETHLFNMIYNLVENGIKYNSNKPEIEITTLNYQKGIVIKVKDNGIGIQYGDQKRIFEKFYRVPKGDLHDVKGYGLGLSYVKLVVDAHHGTIRLNSHPGHGSEFEIYIPDRV